jgi:hypothetical protein
VKLNSEIQAMKVLIINNTTNNIITLRKHVNSNHCNIFLKIEKVNYPLKENEKNLLKRNQIFLLTPSRFFLVAKEPFKKDDV